MRLASTIKTVGVCLALVFLVSLSGTTAKAAGVSDCVQQCLDQWLADRAECEQAYQATMDQLDAAEQECRDKWHNKPFKMAQCIQKVNNKRAKAASDLRKCYNKANTKAYACYRACQQSPTL